MDKVFNDIIDETFESEGLIDSNVNSLFGKFVDENGVYEKYDIYQEGFCVMEGSAQAHYVGSAYGVDFLDACKKYIAEHPGSGYIRKFNVNGVEQECACYWGCRWFPTLAEAQASFG